MICFIEKLKCWLLNFSSCVSFSIHFDARKIELEKYIWTEPGPSSIIRNGKDSQSIKRESEEGEGQRSW